MLLGRKSPPIKGQREEQISLFMVIDENDILLEEYMPRCRFSSVLIATKFSLTPYRKQHARNIWLKDLWLKEKSMQPWKIDFHYFITF